mgnify:CR=1 FL=1
MSYKITYLGLKDQFSKNKRKIFDAYNKIFAESSFILRNDVANFEKKISQKLGTKLREHLNYKGIEALILITKGIHLQKKLNLGNWHLPKTEELEKKW